MRIHGPVGKEAGVRRRVGLPHRAHPIGMQAARSIARRTAQGATTMRPGRARLSALFSGTLRPASGTERQTGGGGFVFFQKAPGPTASSRRPMPVPARAWPRGGLERRNSAAKLRAAPTGVGSRRNGHPRPLCRSPPAPPEPGRAGLPAAAHVACRALEGDYGKGRRRQGRNSACSRSTIRKVRHGRFQQDRRWPPVVHDLRRERSRAATSAARACTAICRRWPSAPRCAPGRRHRRPKTAVIALRIRTRSNSADRRRGVVDIGQAQRFGIVGGESARVILQQRADEPPTRPRIIGHNGGAPACRPTPSTPEPRRRRIRTRFGLIILRVGKEHMAGIAAPVTDQRPRTGPPRARRT